MTRVVYVERGDEAMAVPLVTVAREKVIRERVAGDEVVVRWKGGVASALDSAEIAQGREIGSAAVTVGSPSPGPSNFRPRINVLRAARASSAVCTRAGSSCGRDITERIIARISVVPFGRIADTAQAGSARSAGSVITRIAAIGIPCLRARLATIWDSISTATAPVRS